MIELVDTLPDVSVQPTEYKRLLGYPREHVLSGRARELAEWARSWYAKNGRPWVYARQVKSLAMNSGQIDIDGVAFTSKRLQRTLADAQADGAVVVAVSAGPEVEQEAQRLWSDEKPDEYFFLEIYGSAVVEHLMTTMGARLCAWADGQRLAVLPHYSPGYPDWDIAEQPRLLGLLKRTDKCALPADIEVLESGMLRPKKSLLAVYGLTRHIDRVHRLTDLVPCHNCSLSACQYRRAPYLRSPRTLLETPVRALDDQPQDLPPPMEGLDHDAKYLTSARALQRWSQERLKLDMHDNGTIDAIFRYDGTTCSNMGHAMTFLYHVKLGPREQGYPIVEQQCGPAPGDVGHTRMCRYMNNAEHLMVAIEREKPLLGQRLNEVLTWNHPATGPGCYCEPSSRKHKWGLVLETIHYALVQREKNEQTAKTRQREETLI